jgi:TonB-linked SusC/RagA family outer membrane protein
MGKFRLVLLTALLFAVQFVWAQRRVTGRVTDRDGSPLPGVTVTIKNTNNATVTGTDGTYTITAPERSVLVFSSVGFQTIEAPANSTTVNTTLTAGNNALSEIVVVGYGTRSKRDVTGSIAKINAKEINGTPATSFESALQGRAAGVQIDQQNGKLGQGINIRIRGAASLSASQEPLYVIDGVPVVSGSFSSNGAETNALADINMNDIESIDILKDASAAAIYGSQASNGVVLITTKKGKSGQSKVEFGYYTGLQYPTGKREFMNTQQWLDIEKAAAIGAAKQDYNQGYYATLQDAIDDYTSYVNSRFTRYSAGNTDWQTGKVNTNWQDYAFQRAPISQYDINFNGGTDRTKYYVSGQYLDQDGIIVKNKFKRYSGRINLDQQVKDWLNIGVNMTFARTENYRPSNDDQFSTPLQIVALSPITPVIDPRTGLPSGALDVNSGAPNTNFPVYYNPLLSVDNAYYNTFVNRTLGNVYGNINITKGLSFRTELGADQLNQTEEAYRGKKTARVEGVPNGYGYYITTQVLNINTNNYFHYINTFGSKTNIDITGGMAYQKQSIAASNATAQDFPSDAYKKLSSAATKIDASSSSSDNTLLSYFLRGNLKFNERLLLSLSGRADGSSRFGANHKYGFFPAASAGYILTGGDMLQHIGWLNFFKVKAAYGLTGNSLLTSDYPALALYSGTGAYGGNAGQIPTQIANPDLQWESTIGTDLGFEASIFKNRISIEFDVYNRSTKNLLLNVQIPATSGFATQFKNVGSLVNKGLEVTFNTTNVSTKNFRWTTNLNFSMNKNKVTNLAGQIIGSDQNKAMEGQPIGVFFAREYAGVDPANGDALYYTNTLKSDGTRDRSTTNNYNSATDVVIGDPNPKFIYGFGNTMSFRGIDLDILLQGVYGNKIYNGGGQYMSANASNGFDNQTIDQLSYWKKPGDITMVPEPRLFYANGTDPSSRYISDGSYLRVKSVSLGYSLPSSIIRRMRIDRVRIYVRAQNLFTITKYKGWDPEVNADYQASNINKGVDFYSAPQLKTFVFGVNIGL